MSEGIIYKYVIDPILSDLRIATSKLLSEQLNIIDIACGTGALAFELSKKAKSVTGIDNSIGMIKIAQQIQNKLEITNTHFICADAKDLSQFKTKQFDAATISLAIHQFDTQSGLLILKELKRISKEILVIDYNCPLPDNLYKQFTFIIERLAGREHFKHFKAYQKLGGINTYLRQLNLQTTKEKVKGKAIFSLVLCA